MAGERRAGRTVCVAIAFAAGLVSSCSSGPTLYPVRGTVLHKDKPVAGASVVFHSADASAPMPSGVTGPDGVFTLSTPPHGTGAPPGEYTVLITKYPANARELENPKNELPDRYADIANGLLKATVREGPNELEPFRLTGK